MFHFFVIVVSKIKQQTRTRIHSPLYIFEILTFFKLYKYYKTIADPFFLFSGRPHCLLITRVTEISCHITVIL